MQKQLGEKTMQKKLNRFKFYKRAFKFSFLLKKVVGAKSYQFFNKKLFLLKKLNSYKVLSFKTTSNNIFINLSNHLQKSILTGSSGKYKIKTTKKKIKHNIKIVIDSFFKELKDKLISRDQLIIKITCFFRIRKLIVKLLFTKLKLNSIIWDVKSKKSFNGCREKKKKRKKQKGLRIFK
jgi:ribosomal protein S11